MRAGSGRGGGGHGVRARGPPGSGGGADVGLRCSLLLLLRRAPTLPGLWAATSRARHLGGGRGSGTRGARGGGEGRHASLPAASRAPCGRDLGKRPERRRSRRDAAFTQALPLAWRRRAGPVRARPPGSRLPSAAWQLPACDAPRPSALVPFLMRRSSH